MKSQTDRIHAADALIVQETTPLLDCLRIMTARNVGALIVVGGTDRKTLVGIFTERDLLTKFEKVRKSDLETTPIKRLMTASPKTLDVKDLDKAPRLMLKNNFRHLILTYGSYPNQNKRSHIAGIVSMRDFFQEYVHGKGLLLTSLDHKHREVALISNSKDSFHLFRAIERKLPSMHLRVAAFEDKNWIDALSDSDKAFIDLDLQDSSLWSRHFKTIFSTPSRPKTIVVLFNPQAYDYRTLRALQKIGDSEFLEMMEKPLSVSDVIQVIRK
ncbi:MAG: cyclic nucleotide-binding/CBS domain-containing protein [Bacteriovoracia bacterium]